MEICIDSIESAKNAVKGGASRLEACSALSEGGLTPTPGLIKFIKGYAEDVPVYAMLRIRSGNFVYTREEMDAMLYDLETLKKLDVDGFVFGALKHDGTVDSDFCREIITASRPKPVTFHRAFDEALYPLKSLETIIDLGFERILTSGQRDTAVDGLELITRLIDRANNRIDVMPGGGITSANIEIIKSKSGAREFHASARKRVSMEGGATRVKIGDDIDSSRYVMVANEDLVKQMVDIIKSP